jgi:hypothetical protein
LDTGILEEPLISAADTRGRPRDMSGSELFGHPAWSLN